MTPMTPTDSIPIKVLIALPNEWGKTMQDHLEQMGYSVLLANSKDQALSIIQEQNLDAVIIISDWALESDKGKADGLMESLKGKIPTVSLISQRTWQEARERWFEYLYHPPLHEYCSIPVDREVISYRLSYVLRPENKDG